MTPRPSRGDVWMIDFDPVRGHEQGGTRPGVVVSADAFNNSRALLHVVLPITRTRRDIPWHVMVQPPEGGLREISYLKCEDARSIARERFLDYRGTVTRATLAEVEDRLRLLLEL